MIPGLIMAPQCAMAGVTLVSSYDCCQHQDSVSLESVALRDTVSCKVARDCLLRPCTSCGVTCVQIVTVIIIFERFTAHDELGTCRTSRCRSCLQSLVTHCGPNQH